MSYDFYKVLHITGLLILFTSLGALLLAAFQGQGKEYIGKKFAGMMHGVGLLVALVGGFGLVARLQLEQGMMAPWVIAKLFIWLALGGVIALVNRKQDKAKLWSIVIIILGATAAYIARTKPF